MYQERVTIFKQQEKPGRSSLYAIWRMSGVITGKMHNWRMPVILLTWYNSLVLLEGGSVKFSITIVELLGHKVVFLNPVNRKAGLLTQKKTIFDKGLMEFLNWGNI